EAEQIDPLKVHCLEEGDCVVSHGFNGVRRRAGRAGDADVVEGDHASIRSQRVHEGGIPVVKVAAEVLQQDERHVAATEVAVRVLDPILGRDSMSRGVGVPGWRISRRLFVCGWHENAPFTYWLRVDETVTPASPGACTSAATRP